ncbi:MAG TPA: hypothetical protein G4O08_07925 [Anaerolineae bacterium]|nr:hypothetical protein [Anaerolineae bacterium]
MKWGFIFILMLIVLATISCNFVESLFTESEPPIDLAGVWFNPMTHSESTIVWEDDEFRVISVVDTDDGEVRPVQESDWNGTRIRWTYYVPSTDYTVTFTMEYLEGDLLHCSWFNDHDRSGTRTLERR